MAIKTSIKIKKFWYADVAADGGVGTNWEEIQIGQREASVQFNGSDADITNYPNVLGDNLESDKKTGETTANFQLADLTPEVIAAFTGGTVVEDAEAVVFYSAENKNQSIEKSIKFLSDKNVEWIVPRVSFDGYPIINDDDLHYYQMNSVVLKPTKAGVVDYSYAVLKTPSAAVIKSFSLADETGVAVIDAGAFTVVSEVANGTDLTALEPAIGVSIGASITPNSGAATDFSAPVVFTVTAADGTTQAWTITVTAAI